MKKGPGMRGLSALLISTGIACVGSVMAVAETSESAKEEAAHEKIDAGATLRKSTEVYHCRRDASACSVSGEPVSRTSRAHFQRRSTDWIAPWTS